MAQITQSRDTLIERLLTELQALGINDAGVLAAMRCVPRDRFVSGVAIATAWSDCALPIGEGQTISQPFIVALMTQCLALTGSETVLEIGTGSGYQAAVLARLARQVTTLERIPTLAAQARQTLHYLGCENVRVITGDGALGWPPGAPYDRIIVTAGGPVVPPALLQQLSWQDGKLIMPVGEREDQSLLLIERKNLSECQHVIAPVRFVPLISPALRSAAPTT